MVILYGRNLYVDQEVTVRILNGTTNWFKTEKAVRQGSQLSPCLFNLYVEHIMRNARLDELQAGIKVSGIHVDIWQKTTKFYQAIILQL